MSSELAIVLVNLEEEIGDAMEKIIGSVETGVLSSESILDLCTLSRQMGIGLMLLESDIEGYVAGLFKSGRTYVYLLEKAIQNPSVDKYYLCRGRATPFFDAAAIDDHYSLSKIAALCPSDWQRELEEEDDFWYLNFLICFFQTPKDSELLGNVLVEFERSLEGIASLRYDLCSALHYGNETEFWGALEEFIEDHSQSILDDLQNEQFEPAYANTEAQITIEGIVLVKAGQLAGFNAAFEYLLIPSITLQASLSTYPQEDPWDELGKMLEWT